MKVIIKAQAIRIFLALAALSSSALVLEADRHWK